LANDKPGKSKVFQQDRMGMLEHGYAVTLPAKNSCHFVAIMQATESRKRSNVLPLGGGIAIGRPAGACFASPRFIQKLGGKENSTTPDAGKETEGLRLEAVEYEAALPNT